MSLTTTETPFCLGMAGRGFAGQVKAIVVLDHASSLSPTETERRLIELGGTSIFDHFCWHLALASA